VTASADNAQVAMASNQVNGLTDGILTLRAVEPDDLDSLYRWENDFDQWATTSSSAPLSRHQLWQYIHDYDADIFTSRQIRFVITENASGLAVGTIDIFDFAPADRRGWIGIYLAPEHRGNGYALKAMALLEQYAVQSIGIHQLTALTAVCNESSLALFKAAGYKSCGRLRSWIRYSHGRYEDVIIWQKLFSD
jgi:diamine N-acetyltransferase